MYVCMCYVEEAGDQAGAAVCALCGRELAADSGESGIRTRGARGTTG